MVGRDRYPSCCVGCKNEAFDGRIETCERGLDDRRENVGVGHIDVFAPGLQYDGVELLNSVAMNPVEFGKGVATLLVVLHDNEIECTYFDAVEQSPMGLANVVLEQGREVVVTYHVH